MYSHTMIGNSALSQTTKGQLSRIPSCFAKSRITVSRTTDDDAFFVVLVLANVASLGFVVVLHVCTLAVMMMMKMTMLMRVVMIKMMTTIMMMMQHKKYSDIPLLGTTLVFYTSSQCAASGRQARCMRWCERQPYMPLDDACGRRDTSPHATLAGFWTTAHAVARHSSV